jgi:hypothetical protein
MAEIFIKITGRHSLSGVGNKYDENVLIGSLTSQAQGLNGRYGQGRVLESDSDETSNGSYKLNHRDQDYGLVSYGEDIYIHVGHKFITRQSGYDVNSWVEYETVNDKDHKVNENETTLYGSYGTHVTGTFAGQAPLAASPLSLIFVYTICSSGSATR